MAFVWRGRVAPAQYPVFSLRKIGGIPHETTIIPIVYSLWHMWGSPSVVHPPFGFCPPLVSRLQRGVFPPHLAGCPRTFSLRELRAWWLSCWFPAKTAPQNGNPQKRHCHIFGQTTLERTEPPAKDLLMALLVLCIGELVTICPEQMRAFVEESNELLCWETPSNRLHFGSESFSQTYLSRVYHRCHGIAALVPPPTNSRKISLALKLHGIQPDNPWSEKGTGPSHVHGAWSRTPT